VGGAVQKGIGWLVASCRLALDLAVGEVPDWSRNSIVIRCGVEVDVHEGLRYGAALLGIVPVREDLRPVDVDVVAVVEVKLKRNVGGQVELGVERAGAMAGLDRVDGRELVDVGGAGAGAVQALLDAVAFVLHLGEGQVDFRHDTGDVKAPGVADAATLHGGQVGADALEATFVVLVIVTSADGTGEGAGGEDGEEKSGGGEMHFC